MQQMTELDHAIQAENLDEILRIVSLPDFDINKSGRLGVTPLTLAVIYNKPKLVRVFLKMGANPCCFISSNYDTPLTLSVDQESPEMVQILLEDSRTRDHLKYGYIIAYNALYRAAFRGNRIIVELLLEAGADPASKDISGLTASDFAKNAGHEDLCYFLQEKARSMKRLICDRFQETDTFVRFFNQHHVSIKEAMLPRHPLIGTYNGSTEMIEAIKAGDVNSVCRMINAGMIYSDQTCVDFNSIGSWYACENGSIEIVKILFTLGSSMTDRCRSQNTAGESFIAIDIARKNGHNEIAEYLESLKAQQIAIFQEFKLEQESAIKPRNASM